MATRYWVGGSGTWDTTNTANWATTSGGAGGASVPTLNDDVYIDANSGAVTVTATVISTPCKSLSFSSASGDFTGTWAGIRTIHVYGNLKLSPSMTSTWTGRFEMRGTGSFTVDYNGKSLNNDIFFVTDGSTWQLLSDLTIGTANVLWQQGGTLDMNGKNISCGKYQSNSTTLSRTLNIGTSVVTLTGSNTTILDLGATTTIPTTFIGTPTFNCTYSGATGTRTIFAGGSNATTEANTPNINITAGSDTVAIAGSHRVRSLDFTGFTGSYTPASLSIYGSLTYSSGMTLNASSSTTTFLGTSGTTSAITTNGKTIDNPYTFDANGKSWSFADGLTQGSTKAFTITNGTVKLKAGATSTVGAFSTSGSNQKYLQSTTAGSQATLSQASGTVTVSYLSIKDIAATGGATWNAYVDYNNVDQGDNTGWDFSYSPAIDNEFPVALRSFTQPKRF